MNKCLIVSGAGIGNTKSLRKRLGEYDAAAHGIVIAADSGALNVQKLGLAPTVVIGDFDSLKESDIPPGCEVIRLPVEKDDTDTHAAAKLALQRGYTDITLVCAWSGDIAHSLSNLQTLFFLADVGASVRMLSGKHTVTPLIGGKLTLRRKDGARFSILSFSDISEGVTIEGAKYLLNSARLENTFPLGEGNKILKETATVSLTRGKLIVIQSR